MTERIPFDFDAEKALVLIGKYILVGLSYCDHEGNEVNHDELHGFIESASLKGINISLRGSREGEFWNMPPDLSVIRPASPGVYKIRRTGEDVENPDFIAIWQILAPNKNVQ